MIEDPGYVPKLGSRTQQKTVIDELLSLWKFDDQNFCVSCMVRRPLRSKHCKRCSRCVAKHDQYVSLDMDLVRHADLPSHCPWIHNCVGANNQRHFLVYIIALEAGMLFFIRLAVYRKCFVVKFLSKYVLTCPRHSKSSRTERDAVQHSL